MQINIFPVAEIHGESLNVNLVSNEIASGRCLQPISSHLLVYFIKTLSEIHHSLWFLSFPSYSGVAPQNTTCFPQETRWIVSR